MILKIIQALIYLISVVILTACSSVKNESVCSDSNSGVCVNIGQFIVDVGSLGENSSITFIWNPLYYSYTIQDADKNPIVFIAQDEANRPCLDTTYGGTVKTWGLETRRYRELVKNGKIIQRELIFKQSPTNTIAAVACTYKNINPSKLALAFKILDSIELK